MQNDSKVLSGLLRLESEHVPGTVSMLNSALSELLLSLKEETLKTAHRRKSLLCCQLNSTPATRNTLQLPGGKLFVWLGGHAQH